MSDFTVLTGLFLFVMAGVTLAGYAFWDRAGCLGERWTRLGNIRARRAGVARHAGVSRKGLPEGR